MFRILCKYSLTTKWSYMGSNFNLKDIRLHRNKIFTELKSNPEGMKLL